MLEDRIIVQDRGIDAGLAALMQNANKGMDPAALMAMMNNGGFGGNGGWWWIWIILIFFCWGGFGGNGFGRGGNDASRLASQLNNDANTNLLMQAINGNKEAISSLSNTLNCDINAVQTALNTINSGVSQISCDTKLSSCEVINAITSGNASLASELANCCCTTQRSIDAVNNNITKMGYENQLSVCNQTNNLVNTMNSNTLALRDSGTANTQSIIAKLDAMQNQALLDKIDSLRERNSTLLTQLSQEHQTATFGNMISSATAPIVTKLNSLQSDVDGIKCKLPNVDITIQCNGETKKFTIPENKSVITDNSIGLTISTDKQEIINIVRNQYNTYKQRKEAIAKCDEEMAKCQVLLDKLGVDNEPARENDKILELQKEVSELKNIIRKANQMVPPPMKEMLPQDMKNAMDKVGQ